MATYPDAEVSVDVRRATADESTFDATCETTDGVEVRVWRDGGVGRVEIGVDPEALGFAAQESICESFRHAVETAWERACEAVEACAPSPSSDARAAPRPCVLRSSRPSRSVRPPRPRAPSGARGRLSVSPRDALVSRGLRPARPRVPLALPPSHATAPPDRLGRYAPLPAPTTSRRRRRRPRPRGACGGATLSPRHDTSRPRASSRSQRPAHPVGGHRPAHGVVFRAARRRQGGLHLERARAGVASVARVGR